MKSFSRCLLVYNCSIQSIPCRHDPDSQNLDNEKLLSWTNGQLLPMVYTKEKVYCVQLKLPPLNIGRCWRLLDEQNMGIGRKCPQLGENGQSFTTYNTNYL
jgi:hypothetical protein